MANGRNITGSGINSDVGYNPYAKERKTVFRKAGGGTAFGMALDLSGLDVLLNNLGDRSAKAVRPAAQAAAQVLYEAVQENVRTKVGRKTGNLQNAIYQVYSKDQSTPFKKATYHVSVNQREAPHGRLVEYGYFQRYQYYKRADGQIRPMVRPGMEGKPKPAKDAPQSVKDAYYVALPEPVQVAAKPFIRPARDKFPQARKAAEQVLIRRILDGEK